MLLNQLGKKINSFRNTADLPNLPYGSGKSLLHGLLEISIFEAQNLPDMDGKDKKEKVNMCCLMSLNFQDGSPN